MLVIDHTKVKELFDQATKDLTDTVQKLHLTNKVRHDTEAQLGESKAREADLKENLKVREIMVKQRQYEIDEQEKVIKGLEHDKEHLEIKKQGLDRTVEQTRKTLNDKIENYKTIIEGEHETRDSWIDRYERERRDNATATAKLTEIQASYKDLLMGKKNAEIKLKNSNRQCEVLTQQNRKFQDALNETVAKNEQLERELYTAKEILKQYEVSKKELISKMRFELDTVEERFLQVINENLMVGEDYRARAENNLHKYYS